MKTEYQIMLEEFIDNRSNQLSRCLYDRTIDESAAARGKFASQAEFDFWSKIAKGGPESFTPEYTQQKATRDDQKRVVAAGGGGFHGPPNITQQQAIAAIRTFLRGGGRRSDLPKYANTPDALRNRARRPVVKRGKQIRPAIRHDGYATLRRRAGQYSNTRYTDDFPDHPGHNIGGGYQAYLPSDEPKPRPKPKPKVSAEVEDEPKVTAQDIQRANRRAKKRAEKKGKKRDIMTLGRKKPRGPIADSKYLSKTIDEDFNSTLESVLGL